ncbi:MAG: flagellar basal body-associated protein FliL [Ignavibacteriales bacterium]
MNRPVVKMLLLVLLVIVVAGGVAAGAVYLMTRKPQAAQQAKGPKRGMYAAGDFTTNLVPDNGKNRFIRAKIELEISDEKGLEEMAKQHAIIRDQILVVLRSKTVQDVSEDAGMAALGRHVMSQLNGVLKGVEITGVFFTDFVVQ